MGKGSAIASSGLSVAELSLEVSAANVANARTADFVPGRAGVQEEKGGGAEAFLVKEPDPLAEVRADRALLLPSPVDLVEEIVNQSRAAAVYRANLESLRTDEEMDRAAKALKG